MNKKEIIALLKKEIIYHLKECNKGGTQATKNKHADIAGELFYILALTTNTDYDKVYDELFDEYKKEKNQNEKN